MKKLLLILASTFCININAQFKALIDFNGANGAYPRGSFIFDGTFLYGMTSSGGSKNNGVIFKIKPDGTECDGILDFNGTANGKWPLGSLFYDGTFLYGMTSSGGSNDNGVIFKIKPDGTEYTKLHDFSGNIGHPNGTLISDGTYLYGIARGFLGLAGGYGVIFKIKPDGTEYNVIFNFSSSNGFDPAVGNSLFYNGTCLYGVIEAGGTYNSGSIFKINTDGTEYSEIFSIPGTYNAALPQGALISDGVFLYGMSVQGGDHWIGNVFKIKPDGTNYTSLYDFGSNVNDGSTPVSDLILSGEFLYGMTSGGGTSGMGVIFKVKTDGTGYTKLHDFNGVSGYMPQGSLIYYNGCLFGMTSNGGAYSNGIAFSLCDDANNIDELIINDAHIKIYPNPTSDEFFIDAKTTDKLNVELYDINGRKVLSTKLCNREKINISTLNNGSYFLKIKVADYTINKKLVIIR